MPLFTRKDVVGTKQIFNGHIFGVRLDTVKRTDGKEITREVVEHIGGVVMACQPTPDEILLIQQYRYPIDSDLIELPAGRVEKGEDRLAAAKRELIEETGFKANTWKDLPKMFSAPGFCDELLTCYLASDIEWVGNDPDEDEEIEVLRVTLKEAWQMVMDGKIIDCKTIAILGILSHS